MPMRPIIGGIARLLKAPPRVKVVFPSSQGELRGLSYINPTIWEVSEAVSYTCYTGTTGSYRILLSYEQLDHHSQYQSRTWGHHFTNAIKIPDTTLI